MTVIRSRSLALLAALAGVAFAAPGGAQQRSGAAPTVRQAQAFVDSAERELAALNVRYNQAGWVAATYITEDTEALSAEAEREYSVAVQRLATKAKRYDRVRLPAAQRRKLDLLKLALAAPPPANAAEAAELARLRAGLEGEYGRGTYCTKNVPNVAGASAAAGTPQPGPTADSTCRQIGALSRVLAESRDPAALLDAWRGWHTISRPMRARYARFVELSNKGARELGFANTGVMWRAGYDMPAENFSKELDRLWGQVRPLYLSLHAYTRAKLGEKYGTTLVPQDGPIPAHLLGNMWAQEWGNIYDIVRPADATGTGYDLTALLKQKNVDETQMVKYGERFFTSLGFPALPATFWARSQIVKPRDREVVCHASAWDIDNEDDLRIKMCTEQTAEDFVTVHHELGHNFYQRAYKAQPFLFKNGANDGFHEAIGDAVALSIGPEYLRQVGLLDGPVVANDTALLLRQAMDKVPFLPFGLLIDQ